MLLPSLNLKILRLVGEGLSVIFFFLMALKRGSFSIRISAAMGGALLGSLYSHCGDQIWILPIFLCVLREVAQKKTLFWGLFFFLALNIIAIPDYHVPQPHLWFWSGFWSVGYLAILGIYWALTIKNSSSGSRLKV